MTAIVSTVAFLANLFEIAAAGVAIYLFIFKRQTITSIFRLLTNYAFQATLSELRAKLDRLAELSASEDAEKPEILNLFGDILGQLCGNSVLTRACPKPIRKLSVYIARPETLTEPRKRGLLSELRENIRNADVMNYDDLVRGSHE